jgi:thiol-disulfide isomerase/thioredoxin
MEKILLIIAAILSASLLNSQDYNTGNNDPDAFCQMVNSLYALDAVSFHAQLKVKNIFETDTVITFAKIQLKKSGNHIELLEIIPEEGEKELLFCNDSSWIVDHQAENMVLTGLTIDAVSRNTLSSFFPLSVYKLDSTVMKVEPFWKTTFSNNEYTSVELQISNSSPEVSDIRVFFKIDNNNHLISSTYQEYTYLNVEKGCEELRITDYSFPDPSSIKVPEYYSVYAKDLSISVSRITPPVSPAELSSDIILENIELHDLDGKIFQIPDQGMSFFDLWYVGCSPCLKSAPVIEKLYNLYKDEMYFFSVNEIDKDTLKILRFRDKLDISFPVLLGGKDKLAIKITNTSGYPLFFLMDNKNRKVLWVHSGYSENLEGIIIDAINKFL